MEVLQELLIDAGKPSPGGPHYPSNAQVVSVDMWREYLLKAGVIDAEAKNPREPFRRLKAKLIEVGAIREWDELLWMTSMDETSD